MNEALDAIGQWLTQLTVFGQVAVLLALLLPIGGLAAFLFVGVTDVVFGRISGKILFEKGMAPQFSHSPRDGSRRRVELEDLEEEDSD